jgi:FAD/FMN-containing dehydrogenase/ferredoxin
VTAPDTERAAQELRPRLSPEARVVVDGFERRLCRRDLARLPQFLERALLPDSPLLVVQPKTEADVIVLADFCRERGWPLIPRGIASSAFGGAVPAEAGVVADFSAMNRILAVDPGARSAAVQPGVRWADLCDALAPHGLAPMTTPTSLFSTVGGWVSTGGMGIDGFKYGHLREAVLALRVILTTGQVLELERGDERLAEFFGAEGQLGLITQITLALRQTPRASHPCLCFFDREADAFAFLAAAVERGHAPAHLAFYDASRLAEENALFRDKTGLREDIVEEKSAVFLNFDDPAAAQRFGADAGLPARRDAKTAAARYLWSERFYPMKAQRRGPGMLASEVVLPHDRLPGFLAQARRLARRFGSEPACEATLHKAGAGGTSDTASAGIEAVVIVTFLCDPAGADYLLRLLLVQLITAAGIARGGRPYGVGLWNSPFTGALPSAELARRQALKSQLDPAGLLNPHKSLRSGRGQTGLRALLLHPLVNGIGLRLAGWFSLLLGPAARLLAKPTGRAWPVPDAAKSGGAALLQETAARCTSCGSCIAVCPAWIVTREELVTARAKLEAGQALCSGGNISAAAAQSTFQCVHCGLCEEVCQTALPLRACYDVLESLVASRHGRPEQLIAGFAAKVDKTSRGVSESYGLLRPQWRPPIGVPL